MKRIERNDVPIIISTRALRDPGITDTEFRVLALFFFLTRDGEELTPPRYVQLKSMVAAICGDDVNVDEVLERLQYPYNAHIKIWEDKK